MRHASPRERAPLHAIVETFAAAASEVGDARSGTTIHDVAVDGTFPADGYRSRLQQWARSIVRSRPKDEPPP